MSGHKERNWFLLIPIVFNVLVLMVLPTSLRQWGFERTLIIAVAAMGWPWLLYYLIGRLINYLVERAEAKRDDEHEGFV
jgi:hypothetical protein